MWLDVGRDPFQFYIWFLYRSQEIRKFILPVLYSLCNYKLKLMEVYFSLLLGITKCDFELTVLFLFYISVVCKVGEMEISVREGTEGVCSMY